MNLPFNHERIDGAFIPAKDAECCAPEGICTLAHVTGWTVLAFSDRSVDKRPGSNSAFILHGEHNFEEAVAIAKGVFPSIFARFTFPLIEKVPFSSVERA